MQDYISHRNYLYNEQCKTRILIGLIFNYKTALSRHLLLHAACHFNMDEYARSCTSKSLPFDNKVKVWLFTAKISQICILPKSWCFWEPVCLKQSLPRSKCSTGKMFLHFIVAKSKGWQNNPCHSNRTWLTSSNQILLSSLPHVPVQFNKPKHILTSLGFLHSVLWPCNLFCLYFFPLLKILPPWDHSSSLICNIKDLGQTMGRFCCCYCCFY